MKKVILVLTIMVMSAALALADTVSIKQFTIKENPFARQEIAIVATDTAGLVQESVSGKFAFTINGFDNELTFQSGTAFYRHKVQKSAFMYIKHKNEAGTHSGLYYIYKHGEKLSPLHISWMWLVAIPLIIVFIGYLFKRLIIIAVIILVIFIYFNHSNGLSLPTFFESIFDGLKHAITG
jgi:uncharacterized protein YxeA